MKLIILICALLYGIVGKSEDPFNHFTEEQKQAMQPCMAMFNDVRLCYDYSKGHSKNCTEDFETGKMICVNSTLNAAAGEEIDQSEKHTNSNKNNRRAASDSQCSTAFYTANSQCNGNAPTQSPQAQALMNTIQSQKSVGNIKEACAAAKNLNSMSWSLNATFGMKCQSAISRCLTACSVDSSERDTCKDLSQNVKLAQGQAIENSKSYAGSQECVAAVSGCGNNSYDDPNCPQYCSKPGRQNDSLCTSQKALAENGLQPLQQINSKTTEDSQSNEVGTIYQPKAQEKYQEFDNSKNDLIASDEPSVGSAKAASVVPSAMGSSYASGSAALPASNFNKPHDDNNKEPKPIAAVGSTNTGSNGGGSPGSSYVPTYAGGYPDTFEEPEEKPKWYDLTRFLPLTDAQIDKNYARYTKKLFAEAKRLDWEGKHPNFKKPNPNFQTAIVENERVPASNETSGRTTNRILTIFFLITSYVLIYYFFIREDSENT